MTVTRIIASEYVTGRALRWAANDARIMACGYVTPQTYHYTKHGTDCRDESERVITITIDPRGTHGE